MWRWIRHWQNWVMSEIVTPHRMTSQPQSMYFSCEKAGLVLQNQPIPWGAESVLVEALLFLKSVSSRKKADFTLRLPGAPTIPAESLRKDEASDRYRLFFRFNPPPASTVGEVFWRQHRLGKVDLPVVTSEEFTRDLKIHLPTVFVHIGAKCVTAQSFVANQCKGLTATAIVRSPTGLTPLLDQNFRVVFRWERSGRMDEVAVPLVGSQLAGKEAMVSVIPPKLPRRSGEWSIFWMIGDRVLAAQGIRAVTSKVFLDSLRIADTRFVIETEKAGLQVRRQLPPLNEIRKAGPCFLICSREAGMAGIVNFEISAQGAGADKPAPIAVRTVLVTDGPTIVAADLIDASELSQVTCFDLRHKNRNLGSLPLSPVPLAAINGEGGFKAPGEFPWTNTAEDELLDRLARLMDVDRGTISTP
jgi:hypothetical protein